MMVRMNAQENRESVLEINGNIIFLTTRLYLLTLSYTGLISKIHIFATNTATATKFGDFS